VWGEVLTPLPLLQALKVSRGDVFYDLGSGRGQLVLAAAAVAQSGTPSGGLAAAATTAAGASEPPLSNTDGLRAIGVELLPQRHGMALAALAAAPPSVRACCEFRCGDALRSDLRDATKVFICNLAFPAALNAQFVDALAAEAAPRLERMATAAPLPREEALKAGLALQRVIAVEATWSQSGAPIFVYDRRKDLNACDFPNATALAAMIHEALGDEFSEP